MGQLFATPTANTSGIHCVQEERKIGPDEFMLTLDASAFEFHLLGNLPRVRITLLGLNGAWGTPREYTKAEPYSDANLDVWPESRPESRLDNSALAVALATSAAAAAAGPPAMKKKRPATKVGANNGANKEGAIVIIKKPITVLVKPFQNRITTLLCRNKNYEPVVFANVVLKRKPIEPGTYFLRQDTIFMSGSNLVIVGLPDKARVGNLASLADKNYDPNLTLFMASSLPSVA
jgi:hypothetical protein